MKKKRKDCVFGLHFDFHANPGQTGIGENYADESWAVMLDKVKPDFIQIDSKGHPGISSYPTKVGNAAPDIKADILKNVRRLTAERGVLLYAHHSGVWDQEATRLHPEWGAVRKDGSKTGETNLFCDYAEKLLIPQLKEIASYGLDGAWIDGDCWSVIRDYGRGADEFFAQTGSRDPESQEYADFLRERFLQYVDHYARAVHAEYPDFEIASNWMYTSFCPEKPEADVNFISGDYLPANSVASARVEARLIANQGMHWDLMAWGFNIQHNFFVEKTPVQLMQEAAATLMFGGAFQVYNVQNVGKISERAADGWKEIADFVRERAELVHALPYNRTGYFYSTAGYRYQKEMIYNNPGDARAYDNSGELLAAADTLLNFDGGFTHYFAEHLDEYENLIVCNFGEIEPQMKERILAWVERGGKLFLTGTYAAQAFSEELGFEPEREEGVCFLLHGKESFGMRTSYFRISEDAGRGGLYFDYAAEKEHIPSYFVLSRGAGKIGGLTFDIGRDYKDSYSHAMRKFVAHVLDEIGFSRELLFAKPYRMDVSVQKKENRVYVDLLNLNGDHSNERVRSFDDIPPLTDVEFSYACEEPRAVRLLVNDSPVSFRYENGRLHAKIARIPIHNALVLEY